MMNKGIFIKQLDNILTDYNRIKSKAQNDYLSGNTTIEEITDIFTRAKAAIVRIASEKSEYYKDTIDVLKKKYICDVENLRHVIGTITA